jgi:hypothetical protein
MALPSAIKLFINPRTGLAFGNFNGTSQITNPTVTLGDTARFEIYLVEDTGISSYPRQEVAFPGTPGIKIAVGPIDESPQAGTWTVSFGGDTTAALAYNITAAALAAALNALASITAAGGVTVSKVADNYNIVFNQNGARGDITTNPAALIPLSAATVAVLQVGNFTRPQIALVNLQRTIAGLATSFTATPASAISIESLSAWDGSRATYRASITPDPKGGSFSLAFDAATGTDVSSASISVGASAIDVQNALNLGALADKVSVQQIGAYAYDITVTAQPGTNGLTASGAGLISFNGYVGELSLNTAEAISLLDGAEFVATTLEVEITSDSKTLTVLQIPCTLKNAVIDAGSVQPLVLDTYLSQAAADGRYTRQANNLSDLADINAARTNLGVYSSSSIDSALSLKANLSGATFSGNIVRDNGLGQTVIGPASVSFSQTGGGGSFVTYGSTAVTFADGTTQNTAFTGSVLWGGIGGSLANQTDLASALALKADLAAPTLTGGVTIERNPAGTTLKLYDPTSPNFGTDLNNTNIIVRAGDPSSFGRLDSTQVTVQAGAGNTGGLTASQLAINAGANSLTLNIANGLRINGAELYARKAGDTFTGKVSTTATASTAPINIAVSTTAPTATIAGDVWIGTNNVFFKDSTNTQRALINSNTTNTFSAAQIIDTTATTPGLRITQKGTGSALVVEDSVTPDSDALIVDANGNLGIGVSNNPGSIWTGSTYKAEVHGDALVTGTLRVINHIDVGTVNDGSMTVQSSIYFPNYGGTIAGFTTQTNAMGSSGSIGYFDYPNEIVLKLNGQLWAVPARQIV